MRNMSTRLGHFELDRAEYKEVGAAALSSGKRVLGTFHSHPIGYAVPGPSDLRRAKLNSLMLVYDVCGRQEALWQIVKSGRSRKARPIKLTIERP